MSYHTNFGTEVDHILCLVDFPSFSSDNFQTPQHVTLCRHCEQKLWCGTSLSPVSHVFKEFFYQMFLKKLLLVLILSQLATTVICDVHSRACDISVPGGYLWGQAIPSTRHHHHHYLAVTFWLPETCKLNSWSGEVNTSISHRHSHFGDQSFSASLVELLWTIMMWF